MSGLLTSLYQMCSDVYGHHLNLPAEAHADEAFVDAVRAGYANGQLHDTGHLVMVKATRRLAFLVTVRLECHLSAEALQVLSQRYGVTVQMLEVLPEAGLEGYPLAAAQLDRIEQFAQAFDLTADIVTAETTGAVQP